MDGHQQHENQRAQSLNGGPGAVERTRGGVEEPMLAPQPRPRSLGIGASCTPIRRAAPPKSAPSPDRGADTSNRYPVLLRHVDALRLLPD